MKLLSLLLFTLYLSAQTTVVPQLMIDKITTTQTSISVRTQDASIELCVISRTGIFSVTAGKEQQCWETSVTSHNKGMNDPSGHEYLDHALSIIAKGLGKTYRPCAKEQK